MKVTFGASLKLKREEHDLSQSSLASLIGVTRRQIGRWESGEAIPERSHRVHLARVLGTSILDALRQEEASLAELAEEVA